MPGGRGTAAPSRCCWTRRQRPPARTISPSPTRRTRRRTICSPGPEDAQGSEIYRIQVRDLATGLILDGSAESASGDFAFSGCGRFLFWTWRDEHGRPRRIYRRPARGGDDTLIYEEPDAGFFIGVSLDRSHRWIMITAGDQETSETWLIPADDPTAMPVVAAPRLRGQRYSLTAWQDRFVVHTNADDAVDFKLMQAPLDRPGRDSWREFLPCRPGHFLLGVSAFANHLAWIERKEVNNRILVLRAADADAPDLRTVAHEIAVPEAACLMSLGWRLRIRHHHPALRLPVADDAAALVRVRHGQRRDRPAQGAGLAQRP